MSKKLPKTIKIFIRCPGIQCKTPQQLERGMRTKGHLCRGCKRALVYTIGRDPLIPKQISETVFAGQIEIVTYAARRTRARR